MIIPDCTYCGGHVRIDFEIIDGERFIDERHVETVEVCDRCGVAQKVIHHDVLPPAAAAEIRRSIRSAWRRRQHQHKQCTDTHCGCLCHSPRAA